MRRLIILMAVLGTITARASAQDLYKCKTPDGRTVISNAPCAGGNDETVIPNAAPSTGATASPPPRVGEKPQNRPATKSNQTIYESLKTLRKISAATEVGINKVEYGKLVVDAKAAVDEAIIDIQDSGTQNILLKKEMQEAMQAYIDAFTAWDFYGTVLFSISAEGKNLYRTYNLDERHHSKQDALNIIWKAAKTHLARATELAK